MGCWVEIILGRCIVVFVLLVQIGNFLYQRKQIIVIRAIIVKIHIRLILLHLGCLRWEALILDRALYHIVRLNHFEDLIVHWVGLLLRRLRLASRVGPRLNRLRICLILCHLDQLATKRLVSFFLQGFSLLFRFDFVFIKAEIQLDVKPSYFWGWSRCFRLLLGW